MGLDEEDISNLVRRSNGPSTRNLLRRYWYVFLPVAIATFLFLWFIVWYYSGTPGSPTYPRGAYYGVIGTRDFEKRIFPCKTGVHL